MIEVEGVSHRIGRRMVFEDLSFSVPTGEVFGLVGANGSGKTVLMRILATLIVPDTGRVTIGGHAVEDALDDVRAMIGFVPDQTGAYRRQRAVEYVEFFAGAHGLPVADRSRVANELLEVVGLGARADDDVSSLSRGELQRLNLARALVHDPAVVLIDDVASLDPQAQAELEALVGELHATGKTVVVTSHHLRELQPLCTWVGLLASGTMAASGPVAELADGGSLHDAFFGLGASDHNAVSTSAAAQETTRETSP